MTVKNRMKIVLAVVALFIVVGGIVLIFNRGSNTPEFVTAEPVGYLALEVTPSEAVPFNFYVDNEFISDQNSSAANRELQPGQHTITIKSDGFKDASFDVVIYENSTVTKKISLDVDRTSAENTLLTEVSSSKKPVSLKNGYWVQNATYFSSNTYLAGTLTTTEQATDGEFVILKKVSGDWESLFAGTGPGRTDLLQSGVPESIVDDVLEVSRQ